MIGLMFFLGHIILFVVIIFCTRFIKPGIKRCISIIVAFFIIHFSLFFENFLEIFVTPVYCKLHSNEPVTVYTSPEEWRNKIALDINIKQISGSPNSINPDDFSFYYYRNLEFNDKKYELFAVKNQRPNIVIYHEPRSSNVFRKEEYIYYDIIRNMVLIGKNRYSVFYESLLFHRDYIEECKNIFFDDLNESLNNYR